MEVGSLILCLNTGSSSLKFSFYEYKELSLFLCGAVEEIGEKNGRFWVKDAQGKKKLERSASFPTYLSGIEALFRFLDSIKDQFALKAIGHRVVHGGACFSEPVAIDGHVLSQLKALIPLAPLHLPQELEVIEECRRLFSQVEQIACFDTAFFHALPKCAQRFAIPKLYADQNVIRYGFHGLSYEYIVSKLEPIPSSAIIAHLGNGASLAAIKEGKPVDTSMGFSPAGGVVMGSRLGDIDPGVLIYLIREKKMNVDALEELVYKKSGLLALSGISSDMQTLLQAKEEFAIDVFCLSVAKTIGSYFVVLGGIDQLIFTGGIGERAAVVRKRICERLHPLGACLDNVKNQEHADTISLPTSSFEIRVLPTDENYKIATHVKRSLRHARSK